MSTPYLPPGMESASGFAHLLSGELQGTELHRHFAQQGVNRDSLWRARVEELEAALRGLLTATDLRCICFEDDRGCIGGHCAECPVMLSARKALGEDTMTKPYLPKGMLSAKDLCAYCFSDDDTPEHAKETELIEVRDFLWRTENAAMHEELLLLREQYDAEHTSAKHCASCGWLLPNHEDCCGRYEVVVAALRARVEELERWLRHFLPKKETGPWTHGMGCPAEDDGRNGPCTCGIWADIDAARKALGEDK